MSVRLTAYLPEGAAAECLLRSPAVGRIGRAPDCELTLAHASVSRLHAQLSLGDTGWHLRDLDSKNGTFVEGTRISERDLAVSTWLRFGDIPCEFQLLDAAALARAELRGAERRAASIAHTLRVQQQSALPDLLQATLAAVVDLAGGERGFLLVAGQHGLTVRAWQGLQANELGQPSFEGSVGAVERALRTKAPVVVNELGHDPVLGARASVIAGGLRMLACLPLLFEDEVLGLVYTDNRQPGAVVTTLDLELLQAFAERATLWLAARRSEALLDDMARMASWNDIAAAFAGAGHGRP